MCTLVIKEALTLGYRTCLTICGVGCSKSLVFFFRQLGKSGHVTNIRLAKSRKNTNYHVTSLRRTKGL